MKTSKNGIDLIKKFEGCRLTAYKALPTEKYYTIGYGHYGADVKEGQTINALEAEQLLKNDLVKFENYVNSKNLPLSQNQFDALVSFTFNCGPGNLTKLVKDRTLTEIGNVLPCYNKAGGKVLEGLTRRREEEKALFFSGDATDTYPAYVGTSEKIDEIFRAIGAPCGNVTVRKRVAITNGIVSYCGSFAQNMKLIQLAKEGRLKK